MWVRVPSGRRLRTDQSSPWSQRACAQDHSWPQRGGAGRPLGGEPQGSGTLWMEDEVNEGKSRQSDSVCSHVRPSTTHPETLGPVHASPVGTGTARGPGSPRGESASSVSRYPTWLAASIHGPDALPGRRFTPCREHGTPESHFLGPAPLSSLIKNTAPISPLAGPLPTA